MGFRLGMMDQSYLAGSPQVVMSNIRSKQMVLRHSGLIPDQPLLTEAEWKAIRKYYDDLAPVNPLPQDDKQIVREDLSLFKIKPTEYQPAGAVNTLVKIDEKNQRIIVGDNNDMHLAILDKNLKLIKSYPGYELIVDVDIKEDTLALLSIGDLMGRYSGIGKGSILLATGKSENVEIYTTLISNLLRPADMEFKDLDKDGTDEIVICNFGDVNGSVSVFKKMNGEYSLQQNILNVPGAVKCRIYDFNKDGLDDIAVLFADARENVSIFINRGNLTFERKIVVENHQAFGCTYFEIQDFNNDGFMDLMVVNGDSDADPYNTLKKYHGIRIYLSDGQLNFIEKYFYPMYGAHFARACDYDQDGDLDIAAVSFFPDFDQSKPENFTYLDNKGDLSFEPTTNPSTHEGRWMIMDIGDVDNDKDVDIILGASYIPLGMVVNYQEKFQEMKANGKSILFLENTLH